MHKTKLAERVIELCPDLMGIARTSEQLLSDSRTVQSLVDLVKKQQIKIELLSDVVEIQEDALKEFHAEIERLRAEGDEWERQAFAMASEADAADAKLAKLQAVVDAQREYHERNLNDARAYRADPSHRCDWRVRIEAIESRSRAALAVLEQNDD